MLIKATLQWLGSLALAATFFIMLTGGLLVITVSALEKKEPHYHAQ